MDFAPINHIEIVDGRAMIKDKRVKVRMVISMLVRAGAPIEEVMEQYLLTPAEVHAALAYYHDHKEAIAQSFREGEELLETKATSIELLKAKNPRPPAEASK
jgi:uncharacterized protein (DUF433 family)